MCAAKIRQGRAQEITEGVGRHLADGGGAALVTLTIPHYAGESLRRLLREVAGAYSRVIGSPSWAGSDSPRSRTVGLKREVGIVGVVRALEVTHGAHGWHPHLHLLVLTDHPLAEHEIGRIWQWYERYWGRQVERRFGRQIGTAGVDVRAVSGGQSGGEAVAAYVAKLQDGAPLGEARQVGVGLELARADLKLGRRGSSVAPFELAAIAATSGHPDSAAALALWAEWEQATRGRQAITFTKGLRQTLGLVETTDDDLADDHLQAAALAANGDPPEIHVMSS